MNRNNYNSRMSNKKRNKNQLNYDYLYNQSNNDYDLENRINNSLYPYKSFQRNSKDYKVTTINNISDYNYNSDNNDLLEDFKDTLRRTQQLKD